MKLIAIVAHDQNRLIGNGGNLPWNLPEDLQNFKACTSGHAIIMGSTTFLSIGRPLPNRRNIILSRKLSPRPGIEIFESIASCLWVLAEESRDVFVIGGSQIYQQFLDEQLLDELWVSEVPGVHMGDAYFPEYQSKFSLMEKRKFVTFDFLKYTRIK